MTFDSKILYPYLIIFLRIFFISSWVWRSSHNSFDILVVFMIEWLLFNDNSAIFQLCHGENNLIFNEMMKRSALFQINTLSWIFKVLAHWNNIQRIDISSHSDTLTWFRANQSPWWCMLSGSNTCLFYSLWFGPIGTRTHVLPHSRRAR